MKSYRFNILLFCLLGLVTVMTAQQTSRISLIDKISGKPVAYAHILVESLGPDAKIKNGYLTNEKGIASFSLTTTSKVSATFVGYKNAFDTISPGESMEIIMDPTVYNVDEVVVTAQYRPESVDKSIYKIKVLGTQLIERKAAINMTNLLAGELNIRITQDNILGSSIIMQGLSGEHVKFLVDGVPIIGRQDGKIDLNQMNLINVDHVEVIQGPMSVIYGSNALAGVINIITKESNKQKVAINGESYYESVGQYNFSAGGSYSKNRNSFSLYGSRNFFDGYDTDESYRYLEWKPKLQYNLEGSYTYNSDKTMLKIGGTLFDEEIQDRGNPLEVFNYDKAFDKYYFTRRWGIRSELNQRFNNDGILSSILAYSYYQRIRNTYLKDLTDLSELLVPGDDVQDTTRFENIMFRANYSNNVFEGLIQYQLGVDLNNESAHGDKIENNFQEIGDYAAFLTMEIVPVPQLSIQPGVRFIYNTKYDAPLTYSLNLKWSIVESLSFRISTAKGFRAPSLKELYLNFVDINHDITGNPDLQAEVAQNVNMNIGFNPQTAAAYNWGFDVGLFYNHISNKIQLAIVNPEPLQYSYINVDQFYTHGLELMFNNRVYPWLRLSLGYAITGQKQFIENSTNNNSEYYYYSDFTAQMNYWWQLTDLNFSVFYKYNGSYPQLMVDGEDQVYNNIMDPYNSLDANISRWFWKRRINVQIGGKNLFDVTTVNTNSSASGGSGGVHTGGTAGSRPVAWGRTFFVKLQFSFNK